MERTALPGTVEQLTAVLDSIPTAVIMVDERGAIALVNAETERLFGYTSAELLGEEIDILVPQRYRIAHPELRAQFTKAAQARPMGAGHDLFGLRKDGSEFPIEIGLNQVTTEEGTFVVSAVVDISERKRLEGRFRATVESAPVAIVMVDQDGTIVLVNTETERLFGYERRELLGKKIEALLPARFRSIHPALRSQYVVEPQARRMGAGRDLYGSRKDGSELPVEIGLSPVRMEEGMFVLSTIVDISERAQTKALRQAVEALERSNLELQRFAYVASHDLQTPMRSVAGFVELLRSTYADKLDARANDWIQRIVESVRYQQTLVHDLLDYSRIDSDADRFEQVAFGKVLDDAVSLLDDAVHEAHAEIRYSDLPTLMGDRHQLVQLLVNLVGNALKYRGVEPPRILISAERGDKAWCFAVRDNGIGIDARHYERIFEIFERLHDQGDYPGTGIGLAVCRRIVHRHGGEIWVESEPHRGSVFYFTIADEQVGAL